MIAFARSRPIADVVGFARELVGACLRRAARKPYRPELHYMRGPGPKCRAKGPAWETS